MSGSGLRGPRRVSALLLALSAAATIAAVLLSSAPAGTNAPRASAAPASAATAQGLFADFVKLDRLLTRAIDAAEKGDDVAGGIRQIEERKLALVDREMDAPVDGVKGSEWFGDLDCVDIQLELGRLVDDGALKVPGLGLDRTYITHRLEGAKKCKQALENHLHKAVPAAPAQPKLTPIQAVFTQATFSTVYTENATGQNLHYTWSVSIPADPDCAKGFTGNTPQPNQATWVHKDVSEGGTCNHSGTLYGPRGHPGTVTVVVTDGYSICQASYDGTISGTGPAPQPCVHK